MISDPRTRSAEELHARVPPDWYDRSIRENPFQRFWHRRRFHAVGTLIEKTDGRILDVGCADGTFTNIILGRSGAREVVGVDVLRDSVAWAQEHWAASGRMRFEVADAHRLPFPDASFDAVFCLEMLEHVHDPLLAMREMRRILREGGYGIFLVPSDNLLFRTIWAAWTRLRGQIWEGTHIQSFQGRALGELARQAGFRVERETTFLLGMLSLLKVRKG